MRDIIPMSGIIADKNTKKNRELPMEKGFSRFWVLWRKIRKNQII